MKKWHLICGAGLVVAVVAARADEESDAARKAVVGLVKDLEAKKDITKAAAGAAKKHELYLVMAAFKPAARGGIGVGAKGESIEVRIAALEKGGVPADGFTKSKGLQKELLTVGRVSQAIAEMTRHGAAAYARNAPKQKLWNKYSQEMKKGAEALIAAAEGKDAAKVKKAAEALNNSCLQCHADFRDS